MAFRKELQKTGHMLHPSYPHREDAPILRAEGLSLRYESGAALDNVSFELTQGERLAVVGPNGAGKSTLFKIIAGVTPPSSGQVQVAGSEPDVHICIAYVQQRSTVDWNFPATVADTVMMGRIGKIGLFRFPSAADWEIVNSALDTVGLTPLAKRQISQLSGGQQQRMFIARALAQEAELVLMDEPFTGLDAASQEDIFRILDALQARGVTVMIALHDLDLAARRFDRVMLLNRRLLGIGRPEAIFTPERLLTAYGGRLRVLPGLENLALDDSCCAGEHEHEHD